jgi:hypothetical protein
MANWLRDAFPSCGLMAQVSWSSACLQVIGDKIESTHSTTTSSCLLPSQTRCLPTLNFSLSASTHLCHRPLPQPSYGCLICLKLGVGISFVRLYFRERALGSRDQGIQDMANVARSSACIDAQVACKKFGKVSLFLSNGLSQNRSPFRLSVDLSWVLRRLVT